MACMLRCHYRNVSTSARTGNPIKKNSGSNLFMAISTTESELSGANRHQSSVGDQLGLLSSVRKKVGPL